MVLVVPRYWSNEAQGPHRLLVNGHPQDIMWLSFTQRSCEHQLLTQKPRISLGDPVIVKNIDPLRWGSPLVTSNSQVFSLFGMLQWLKFTALNSTWILQLPFLGWVALEIDSGARCANDRQFSQCNVKFMIRNSDKLWSVSESGHWWRSGHWWKRCRGHSDHWWLVMSIWNRLVKKLLRQTPAALFNSLWATNPWPMLTDLE